MWRFPAVLCLSIWMLACQTSEPLDPAVVAPTEAWLTPSLEPSTPTPTTETAVPSPPLPSSTPETLGAPDQDHDGFCVAGPCAGTALPGDCNDWSASAYPGASEQCNGLDDDCDGAVDEGMQSIFYQDKDKDGYGRAEVTTVACSLPTGFAILSGDCDDSSSEVYPGAAEQCDGQDDDCDGQIDNDALTSPWYEDQDGDGYGQDGLVVAACAGPAGYSLSGGDCNDEDDSISPGAEEKPCDNIDGDCDGNMLEEFADGDGDGFDACAPGIEGADGLEADCNDDDPAQNPEAEEQCNGADDDCDGVVDDVLVLYEWYADEDGDGVGGTSLTATACMPPDGYVASNDDCDDEDPLTYPGAAEVVCDGISQGCSDELEDDHPDADMDGYDVCPPGVTGADGYPADCRDSDAVRYPGAMDWLGDDLDSDCDGHMDWIFRVAGAGFYNGDEIPATEAALNGPISGVSDAAGNVYIADTVNHRIRKVDLHGVITTLAGDGTAGSQGDGGPATSARIDMPFFIAIDRNGSVLFSDTYNCKIRRIDVDGVIHLVAGSGVGVASSDGGAATSTSILFPAGIAVDGEGTLFFAEVGTHRIRMVDPKGIVRTVAGTGLSGYSGDGGAATRARLNAPYGISIGNQGELYIADTFNNVVRVVDAGGTIRTLAGNGAAGYGGDGGAATLASLNFPVGVFAEPTGGILIGDSRNNRVRFVDGAGNIQTICGTGNRGNQGNGGSATVASLDGPGGIWRDSSGNLFIADTGNDRIQRVELNGVIDTIAGLRNGLYAGDGGPASEALLAYPYAVAADMDGNIFIADTVNHRVRRVDLAGNIDTVAGTGLPGSGGENGPATQAGLNYPNGVHVSPDGTLYIADTYNCRVCKVTSSGILLPVAGRQIGYLGDGGPATLASLNGPSSVVADDLGNLWIADSLNHVVRHVSADGLISTYAGNGTAGYSGDGGPATLAQLRVPQGIVRDSLGRLYIADSGDHRVRRVSDTDLTIETLAGNGTAGRGSYPALATEVALNGPWGLAMDPADNLFISDTGNHRILKVNSRRILTSLGGVNAGYGGDGGPASYALLNAPRGLAMDGLGNLYVADTANVLIRVIDP